VREGAVIWFICLIPVLMYSQNGKTFYQSGDFFGASAELGFTTFMGDIDEGIPDASNFSDKTAYQIKGYKNFNSLFNFSGRISFGKMTGQKIRGSNGSTTHFYFKNSFVEYSFDAGVNLLAIFTKRYNERFGLYGSVGLGLIDFRVNLYNGLNDTIIQSFGRGGEKATTEFVLPLGIRAIYHVSPTSAFSIQATTSRVDTDKLDGRSGNHNRDYYNYFSFGYIYKFIPRQKVSGAKRQSRG